MFWQMQLRLKQHAAAITIIGGLICGEGRGVMRLWFVVAVPWEFGIV